MCGFLQLAPAVISPQGQESILKPDIDNTSYYFCNNSQKGWITSSDTGLPAAPPAPFTEHQLQEKKHIFSISTASCFRPCLHLLPYGFVLIYCLGLTRPWSSDTANAFQKLPLLWQKPLIYLQVFSTVPNPVHRLQAGKASVLQKQSCTLKSNQNKQILFKASKEKQQLRVI